MSSHRSRTAQPLEPGQTTQAMGVWAVALTLLVLVMFVAGLSAAPLYLETGQPRADVTGEPDPHWPPEGIDAPDRTPAGLAMLVIAGAALSVGASVRRTANAAVGPARLLLAAAVMAAVGAVVLLVRDLQRVPFGWQDHAFTSVYWALTGVTALFVGVLALMAAAALVQHLTGVVDARRHLELVVTAIYGGFTVAASAILLGLVHLLPTIAGTS
jgi:heme/copper-type cytochrome/quinol oxidase subunit 3